MLHLGTRKTGTTAIQQYLAKHQQDLSRHFLHRGDPNSSLWMTQAFSDNLGDKGIYKGRNLPPEELARLRELARWGLSRQINKLGSKDAVLSAEVMASMSEEELAEARTFFSQRFTDIATHIYFRPMKSLMESSFQERLKHRHTNLEEDYAFAYPSRIRILDKVFGKSQVHVHKFDRRHFPDGNIVQHFLNAIGENHTAQTLSVDNESLSLPAIQLLYHYRKAQPARDINDRKIVRRLTELEGPPLRFHSTLYDKLLRRKSRDMDEFEKRVGFSVDEDLCANDAGAISSEEDLLAVPPSALEWLAEAIQQPVTTSEGGVASMVMALGDDAPSCTANGRA
ncbi:hypothetical protein BST95_15680 [Halioglobus japonicus]|uniref:Uncharacterized protein n=1 Tax=Halioglobus japonicus TaxID=930805 RepID=A0AAP8SPA3_9GAMM|nr:hypothetical protein [Halioglobus japonicus]AQA19461.1 hypothetical protein BST95_15680 [Halioglobus japonicus]PLW87482.1 hypothetical protein C0029_02515 [Halioglobus japonicus]